MQGTGTQTDPYIPTAWDEFVTAIGTSGAYVELPEGGGVFDMDEIDPEGGFGVNIKCVSILGNDWEIRNANNIQFYANQGSTYKIIDKLHFLNFNYNSINAMFTLSYSTLTRCKFSGIHATSSSLITGGTLRRCSLNIKCLDNALEYNDNSSFYFSKIVLDQSDSLSTAYYNNYSRINP